MYHMSTVNMTSKYTSTSTTTVMHFLLSELQELNTIVKGLQVTTIDLNRIPSWLKPTKTYANIVDNLFDSSNSSYLNVLENIIDRLYLVLNVVLMKLEEFTGFQEVGVERPLRLSISALSRIIIEKLLAFSRVRNSARHEIQRDVRMQTDFAEDTPAAGGCCGSCLALFECFSGVENLFCDVIAFHEVKHARSKVRQRLFLLNNSQSMRIMCDAIHDDLRVFHDDYRILNESHAALKQQYNGLMNDFVNYTAECDAKFAQNEDGLKLLGKTLQTLHDDFSKKLENLVNSSTYVSESSRKIQEAITEKEETLEAILKYFAHHLQSLSQEQTKMADKMASALDLCAQRITKLQTQFQQLQQQQQQQQSLQQQLQVLNNARKSVYNQSNQVFIKFQRNSKVCGANHSSQSPEVGVVPLAGSDPVADMLQHIESNRSQIDYLQRENVALERTIARIKMLVT